MWTHQRSYFFLKAVRVKYLYIKTVAIHIYLQYDNFNNKNCPNIMLLIDLIVNKNIRLSSLSLFLRLTSSILLILVIWRNVCIVSWLLYKNGYFQTLIQMNNVYTSLLKYNK